MRASLDFDPIAFSRTLSKGKRTGGVSPLSDIDPNATGVDLWPALLDLETWVCGGGMNEWWERAGKYVVCTRLRKYIMALVRIGKILDNPENFSRVFLMVLELWVTLDRLACANVMLLDEYPPELKTASFEPLILPTRHQMERLVSVEMYIKNRHEGSDTGNPSIFSWTDSDRSFAYRFYSEDPDEKLKHIHESIKSDFEDKKRLKIDELRLLNAEHAELFACINRMNYHTEHTVDRHRRERIIHDNCRKCSLQRDANAVTIEIIEEPLPEDPVHAAAVLLELGATAIFRTWRDITHLISREFSPSTQYLTFPAAVARPRTYPSYARYIDSMPD